MSNLSGKTGPLESPSKEGSPPKLGDSRPFISS